LTAMTLVVDRDARQVVGNRPAEVGAEFEDARLGEGR